MVRDRTHQQTLDELRRERDKRELVDKQLAYSQTLVQFLCARINHLERNQAVLLKAVTKLDFDIPVMRPAPSPSTVTAAGPADAAQEMLKAVGGSLFDDMGDEEARKQGINWKPDGTVDYGTPLAPTEH